ncbi:WAP four-disulfide core domain protein 2-like [Penaeus vannamei]
MSSTAVRVCALLLVVLMVENSWARLYYEKSGVCPLSPVPPPFGNSNHCHSDYDCPDNLKCCPVGYKNTICVEVADLRSTTASPSR